MANKKVVPVCEKIVKTPITFLYEFDEMLPLLVRKCHTATFIFKGNYHCGLASLLDPSPGYQPSTERNQPPDVDIRCDHGFDLVESRQDIVKRWPVIFLTVPRIECPHLHKKRSMHKNSSTPNRRSKFYSTDISKPNHELSIIFTFPLLSTNGNFSNMRDISFNMLVLSHLV
jgi:hypothetical protein